MFSKYFTLKEANQALPQVKKIVTEILSKGQTLQRLLADEPPDDISPQAEKLADDIERLMGVLEGKGCFYKDWNFKVGLVDFPAVIYGEDALLCWKSDEPEILWYHSLEDGFAGRRPIPAEWLLEGVFIA